MSEEIYIYGDISHDEWIPSNITSKKIKDSLDKLTDTKELKIHINSFGGSVLEGFGIISIIDKFKKDAEASVEIYIDGIAAGIASAIVMTGDKIYMAQNASFMLRKSFLFTVDESEIEKRQETLKKFDDALVTNYMRRFNGAEKELHQLMKNETWLNAEEAMKYGFIDEII